MVAEQVAELGIKKYFKFSLVALILILVFAGSIVDSFQQRDPTVFFYKIASVALVTTNHATVLSETVLSNNSPVFDLSFRGVYNYLSFYSDFILSIYIIFVILGFLATLISNSFISNQQNTFTNYFLAIIIYIILQGLLIVGIASVYHQVDSMGDFLRYLYTPIRSLQLILKAILYIIAPISSQIDRYTNQTYDISNMPGILQ